jgi:hypothetical protein
MISLAREMMHGLGFETSNFVPLTTVARANIAIEDPERVFPNWTPPLLFLKHVQVKEGQWKTLEELYKTLTSKADSVGGSHISNPAAIIDTLSNNNDFMTLSRQVYEVLVTPTNLFIELPKCHFQNLYPKLSSEHFEPTQLVLAPITTGIPCLDDKYLKTSNAFMTTASSTSSKPFTTLPLDMVRLLHLLGYPIHHHRMKAKVTVTRQRSLLEHLDHWIDSGEKQVLSTFNYFQNKAKGHYESLKQRGFWNYFNPSIPQVNQGYDDVEGIQEAFLTKHWTEEANRGYDDVEGIQALFVDPSAILESLKKMNLDDLESKVLPWLRQINGTPLNSFFPQLTKEKKGEILVKLNVVYLKWMKEENGPIFYADYSLMDTFSYKDLFKHFLNYLDSDYNSEFKNLALEVGTKASLALLEKNPTSAEFLKCLIRTLKNEAFKQSLTDNIQSKFPHFRIDPSWMAWMGISKPDCL